MKQSRNRILSVFAAAALAVCVLPVSAVTALAAETTAPVTTTAATTTTTAAAEPAETFDFEFSGNADETGVTITKYTGSDTVAEIPDKIGDLPVTDRIMEDTFWIGVYPGMTAPMIDKMVRVIHEAVVN